MHVCDLVLVRQVWSELLVVCRASLQSAIVCEGQVWNVHLCVQGKPGVCNLVFVRQAWRS